MATANFVRYERNNIAKLCVIRQNSNGRDYKLLYYTATNSERFFSSEWYRSKADILLSPKVNVYGTWPVL